MSDSTPDSNDGFFLIDLAVSTELNEATLLLKKHVQFERTFATRIYNSNLELVSNNKELSKTSNGEVIESGIFSLGDYTYLLTRERHSNNSNPLYAQRIEKDGKLNPKKKALTSTRVNTKKSNYYEHISGASVLLHSISPDKSKIAIAVKCELQKYKSKLLVKVYNTDLSLVYSDSLSVDEVQGYKDLIVDNDGTCYLTTQAYNANKTFTSFYALTDNHYITVFSKQGPQQTMLDLKDCYISDSHTLFLKNGDIQIVGFYFDVTTGINGMFYQTLESGILREKNTNFTSFTYEHLISEAYPFHYKWQTKLQKNLGVPPYLKGISFNSAIETDDGGRIIIGQIIRDQINGPSIIGNEYSHTSKELHLFCLDSNGKLRWTQKINTPGIFKRPITLRGSLRFQDSANIYIVYHDNPDKKRIKQISKKTRESRLMVTSVNKKTGKKSKGYLLKNGKKGEGIIANTIVKSSENQYWCLGYDSYESMRVIKITLNN
jgi:hypothetical protein